MYDNKEDKDKCQLVMKFFKNPTIIMNDAYNSSGCSNQKIQNKTDDIVSTEAFGFIV